MVLRRPLRSRRRLPVRGDACAGPPAHRAADRLVALQRRGRAPRHDGRARPRPPGGAQHHDRRCRHRPLGVLHRLDHDPARRAAVGGPARGHPALGSGLRALRARGEGRRRRPGPRPPRDPLRRDLTGVDAHRARRCRGDPPGRREPRHRGRRRARARDALRHRSAHAHRPSRRLGHRGSGGDRLRADRLGPPARRGRRGRRAAPAPRRPAARRADRHVVELHRSKPRGGRRLPRGLAARASRHRGLRRRRAGRARAVRHLPCRVGHHAARPELPHLRLRSRG